MNKGILMDMGDTIVHNINVDFKRGLEKIFDLAINKKEVDKQYFLNYSFNLLNDIFKYRSIVEFKMIDFLNNLIDIFNLKFTNNIYELEQFFSDFSCDTVFVNDIEIFLKYLKSKNYKIIILSNTSFSKNILVNMLKDLNKYFDEILVSSDYPLKKPHHSFFDVGIKKLDISKENIYYIGNSFYNDVYGAYTANINSIWFNEEQLKPEPQYECNYKEITSYKQLIYEDF